MILITGGLGFIGLHTARCLVDAGEQVVLTQYRVARDPDFLRDEIGRNAFVEQLEVTDAEALGEIGRRHEIDGIVHLAVPGLGALSAAEDYRVNMVGLLNVLQAAEAWGVKRLSLASSTAVYSGLREGPFREDMPLRMIGQSPTEAFKKAFEILGSHYALRTGLNIVMLRIAGIYGPLYHSMSNLPSRLVHAAVRGVAPDLRGEVYAEDAADICYVKDCARGIALLQTAETLAHSVYNIGSGRATSNAELVRAIESAVPGTAIPLTPGRSPEARTDAYLDITRIRQDTGYEPEFQVEKAISDYVAWLRTNPE
jgi:UDP-glucose 4-epimerase